MTSLTTLSDRKLLSQLETLVDRERTTTLNIVLHLGEVERRGLHLKLAYASMFEYCMRHLGYSSSAAGRRLQLARAARRHPELLRALRRREINLMTAGFLAPVLTDENKKVLLEKARNKTQREVERLVDAFRTAADVPDRVRSFRVRVPVATVAAVSAAVPQGAAVAGSAPAAGTSTAKSATGSSASAEADDHSQTGSDRNSTVLLTTGCGEAPTQKQTTIRRLLVTFSASEAFMKKYEEAKALLSNKQGPAAGFEEVFEAALDAIIDKHSPAKRQARRDKRKQHNGNTDDGSRAPRNGSTHTAASKHGNDSLGRKRPSKPTRHIPTEVRDEVYERDNGQCTYKGPNGKRCEATLALHVDHIKPFAKGGSNYASNLRLLCASHNQLQAERAYGKELMARYHRRE